MADPLRTPTQSARIWILVGELQRVTGLAREDVEGDILRPLVRRLTGQESTTRLTMRQAAAVIADLEARVARVRKSGDAIQDGEVTRAQSDLIADLWCQLGWGLRQQRAFCVRQFGAQVVYPRNSADAAGLIEALKAMILRRVSPIEVWRRVQALHGRPELDPWHRAFVADLLRRFSEGERTETLAPVLTTARLAKVAELELQLKENA